MNQELSNLIGILLAIVLGYLLGQAQYWHENRLAINLEVWKERCAAYKKLMEYLGALTVSKYPDSNEEITYYDLLKLIRNLQDWYFTNGGGLLLTEESREKYRMAEAAIRNKLENQLRGINETGRRSHSDANNDYDFIRELLAALRIEISRDLLG